MFRSIVASAAVVALAAGATAQSQLPAGSLNKTVTPSAGVYSMETGFEVTTQAYRSGPEVLFNNRAGLSYYYTTVLDTDEYVDEGAFAQRGVNGTEQVNGMTWEYCSGIPDSVGDALSVDVRFYNDTILGTGPTGWTNTTAERGAACAFGVAGLPGDTALTGLSCWIITLDLAGGFECTLPQETTLGGQEPFGMSVVYLDATGSTGPILDSITGGAAPGYGAQDYFEWFDTSQPAGAEYQGAFFFGGGAKVQGSFNMELAGNVNDTEAYYSAAPGAADTVDWQATAEVRAGAAAGWAVTNPDGVSNYGMLVSNGSADLPVVAGGTASLLVNSGGLLTSPIPLGTSGAFGIILPGSVPSSIYTQAVAHTGALTPSNTTAASNGLVHSN